MKNGYIFINKVANIFHLWVAHGNFGIRWSTFFRISQNFQSKACGLQCRKALLRFKTLFGVVPLVCAWLWTKLSENLPSKGQPVYLLYALLKLKTYASDSVCAIISSCDEKTFRRWCWPFIHALSRLSNVCYLDLFVPLSNKETLLLRVFNCYNVSFI